MIIRGIEKRRIVDDRWDRRNFVSRLGQVAFDTETDVEDWSVVPTLVEEGASVGSSVTILCGVIIGAGAIVGAGSVVTKDIPPGEIWAGNPARFLRKTATR